MAQTLPCRAHPPRAPPRAARATAAGAVGAPRRLWQVWLVILGRFIPSARTVERHRSCHPPLPPGCDDRLARVRFRRAVTLMVMTLFVPGSAQLVAGRRQVGRVAIRVWLVRHRRADVRRARRAGLARLRRFLACNTVHARAGPARADASLAVGWARALRRRLAPRPAARAAAEAAAGDGRAQRRCCASRSPARCCSPRTWSRSSATSSPRCSATAPPPTPTHGRYNVLLLGGDSGADRWGLRPDSITVASIDEETGHDRPVRPAAQHGELPVRRGLGDGRAVPRRLRLRGLRPELRSTPGRPTTRRCSRAPTTRGVEATIEGVEGITGLTINYYAMVNLKGFRSWSTRSAGSSSTCRDRIPIGGVGGPVTGYIEPGYQRLDGFETLWFARSRESADDYSRMARQKCVMNAMLHQLSPQVVVTKFEQIAKAGKAADLHGPPGLRARPPSSSSRSRRAPSRSRRSRSSRR